MRSRAASTGVSSPTARCCSTCRSRPGSPAPAPGGAPQAPPLASRPRASPSSRESARRIGRLPRASRSASASSMRRHPSPTGCRRVWALQRPDVTWLRATEESRQIRIEQVRDLAAELALTAHGGGYKVGIVSPADALNRFAANALLKTLEEPPPGTLLVLTAT